VRSIKSHHNVEAWCDFVVHEQRLEMDNGTGNGRTKSNPAQGPKEGSGMGDIRYLSYLRLLKFAYMAYRIRPICKCD